MKKLIQRLPNKEVLLFLAVLVLAALSIINAFTAASTVKSSDAVEAEVRQTLQKQAPALSAGLLKQSQERPSVSTGQDHEEQRRRVDALFRLPTLGLARDPFFRASESSQPMPALQLSLPEVPDGAAFVPVIGFGPGLKHQLRPAERPSGPLVLDPKAVNNPFEVE